MRGAIEDPKGIRTQNWGWRRIPNSLSVPLANQVHDFPGHDGEEHQQGHDHHDPQPPMGPAVVVVAGMHFGGVPLVELAVHGRGSLIAFASTRGEVTMGGTTIVSARPSLRGAAVVGLGSGQYVASGSRFWRYPWGYRQTQPASEGERG